MEASAFKFNVTKTYRSLYTIYIRPALTKKLIEPGEITVLIDGIAEFSTEGTLNPHGRLSGMAALYDRLNIQADAVVEYRVIDDHSISITCVTPSGSESNTLQQESPEQASASCTIIQQPTKSRTIFTQKNLAHIHIEMFRPENLKRWNPENEPDVYMVFGLLQEYTKYRYCCATSKSLLDRLGYTAETKPDAILINDSTKEYLIAEFKMKSSDFKSNHKKEDIDVLVVWDDEEPNREILPNDVLCLREIARTVAIGMIGDE